ncbi:MAG TPA: DUF4261 domain-containing protein [Planctomycetota bacterium]|nr:DUF4261 domain-containing protein [Planctomycetota bacterium]
MNTPVSSYAIDLLYDELPLLTRDEILGMLRDRCGAASAMDNTKDAGLNFYFPDLRAPYKESTVPVQVAMAVTSGQLPVDQVMACMKQTWDWGEAKGVVARHQASVTMSDLLASALPYKTRLGFFQNVLGGILELLMPIAIRWRPSGKFVNPKALLLALKPGDKRDLIKGAVNVRRTLVKSVGGVVLDTVGLGALGLPDFQVSLGDRLPALFEAALRSLARYEFDLGDVFADGRTVKCGPESYTLARGISLVEPKREVFVLNPA